MKTITEFAAPVLKNASQKHAELTAAGKTAEEMPAAMGEALTLEGDKLTHLMGALEALGTKTHELKRVIVSTLAEGETAPSNAKLIGEKYYTTEYYMPMVRNDAPQGRDAKGGRDGKGRGGKGGGRDGKGRGGPGGDRGAGGGRGPGGDRGAPRGPRPEGASASPSGGKPNVKPNVVPVAPKETAPTS